MTYLVLYETIFVCGTNCGIGELDFIAGIIRFCNEFGLDTIEIRGSLAIPMEGGLVPFGDVEGAKKLLEEIEANTVTGRMLGNGAVLTGKVLGVARVPVVKGQMMPGYDPRAIKGHGVTYAISPTGADHTAGLHQKGVLNLFYIAYFFQKCKSISVSGFRPGSESIERIRK